MANENDVKVGFGADTSGLDQGFRDAAASVGEGAKKIVDGMEPAGIATVALGNALGDLVTNLVGKVKEALRNAVLGFSQLGDEVEHMQRRIGGSAQSVSELKVALESVGLSSATFESIARRLPQVIQQNSEKLKAAGVAYTDVNGNLLTTTQTILNFSRHLETFSAGAARNTEGVRLLGRAYYMMADIVELTSKRQEEAAEVARRFGLVLSEEDVEAADEFSRQTNLLKSALEGFSTLIGRAVTPLLTDLAVVVRNLAGPVFSVFKVAVEVTAGFLTGLAVSINILWTAFVVLSGTAYSLTKLLGALFTLDGKAAVAAWDEWKTGVKGAVDDMVKYVEEKNADLARLITGPGKGTDAPPSKDPNADKVSTGTFAIMEAEAARALALRKQALQEASDLNDAMHRDELTDEQSFWAEKIRIVQAGIDAEMAKLRADREVARKQASQEGDDPEAQKSAKAKEIQLTTQLMVLERQRVAAAAQGQMDMLAAVDARIAKESTAELESVKKIALTKLDTELATISHLREMNQITDEEAVTAKADIEMQKLDIEREALAQRARLHGEWTEEYREIQRQLSELDERTNQRRLELTQEVIRAQQKDWMKLFGSMESGFKGVIQRFLSGTATMGETIRGLFTSVLQAIEGVIAEIAARWLAQQIMQMVLGKTTAASQISAQAAAAGAGGVASMAAAPFPINLSAPAFGASMAAAASAFSALLAGPGFAVGSWNVPEDGFAKIHKGETIMPEPLAEKMRSGGMGGDTFQVSINATDGASVKRMLMKHSDLLVSAFAKSARNFRGSKKS